MTSEQLDRDIAELYAGPPLTIDPDSELNRAILRHVMGAPEAQTRIAPGDDEDSAPTVNADFTPKPEKQRENPRTFALAAAIVAFVLIGGIVAISLFDRGNADLETTSRQLSSSAGLPWTPPPSQATSGIVRGPDTALVVLVPPELMGQRQFVESCFSWLAFDPLSMGLPVLMDVGYVEAVDELDATLFTSVPQLFGSCTPSLGGGGGTLNEELSNDSPVVFGGSEWGEPENGPIEVSREGLIAEEVASLELVGIESQVFRTDGTHFILEYEVPAGTSDPTFEDSSVDVRLRFDDGTEEVLPIQSLLSLVPGEGCGDAETCVLEQAELALLAGAQTQAEALADGVLGQTEYAGLVERFSNCLDTAAEYPFPPNLSAVVPEGSSMADVVNECFDAELRFVEQARSQQNLRWFTTDEGREFQSAQGITPPAFTTVGSVVYLVDNISNPELTELVGEIRQLNVGAYRYVTGGAAYRQFIDDFGASNVAASNIDPSLFPDRIELLSNAQELWTPELRELRNLDQVESLAQPVTLDPNDWVHSPSQGVEVGIVSEAFLPEEFPSDDLD